MSMFLFNFFSESKDNDHITTISTHGCVTRRIIADNYSVDNSANFYLNLLVFEQSA